jgi:hypothetical protein
MPSHETKPRKLGREPTEIERDQLAFLLNLLDYVEKQRPDWMKEKGEFLVEGRPGLHAPGICEMATIAGREWPRIHLWRPERQDTPGPAIDETCTLAHEFGHCDAYRRIGFAKYDQRQKWRAQAESEKDGWKKLSEAERQILWTDEVEAWETGQRVLAELGFTWWEQFEDIKERCLSTYRKGLNAGSKSEP